MAATYRALATSVTLPTSTADKTLLSIYNLHATQKINIIRVWVINIRMITVTGVYQRLVLGRHTTDQTSGSTTVTPFKMDTNSADLLNATCKHSPTTNVTITDEFRSVPWSGDEYTVSGAKLECLLGLPAMGIFWDSGYGNTSLSPIVLNQNEGLAVNSDGVASGVGTVDVCMEFYVS